MVDCVENEPTRSVQVLLPLDVLKIKRQVNPETFRGRGVLRVVADEGFALYRGWGWTMARNAPGSFAVCIPLCHQTLRSKLNAESILAIWRICIYKRYARDPGLLKSNVDAKLHCICGRRRNFYYCSSSSRRRKDTHSKRKFRTKCERCHSH